VPILIQGKAGEVGTPLEVGWGEPESCAPAHLFSLSVHGTRHTGGRPRRSSAASIPARTVALLLFMSILVAAIGYRRIGAAPREVFHAARAFALAQLPGAGASASYSSRIRRVLRVRPGNDPAIKPRPRADWHQRNLALLTSLIAELNGQLDLPQDIDVSLGRCGGADAYYDEADPSITICDELIDEISRLAMRSFRARAIAKEVTDRVIESIFLHELSHALIDVLKLPITGREEDAADQFSTLVMMNRPDGEASTMRVARVYGVLAQIERREGAVTWDEHSLDSQRYYDMLCMLYGRDQTNFGFIVTQGLLPEERAQLCHEDFGRVEAAWKTLLKPYAEEALWAGR
jgi:hypothetical protein